MVPVNKFSAEHETFKYLLNLRLQTLMSCNGLILAHYVEKLALMGSPRALPNIMGMSLTSNQASSTLIILFLEMLKSSKHVLFLVIFILKEYIIC